MAAKSKAKFTIESLYQALAVLAILTMCNLYAVRHVVKRDLTEASIFTMAEQTKKVFSSLTEPVEAMAFFQAYHEKEGSKPKMRHLLTECAALSNGKFTFRFIDPDKKPSLAMKNTVRKARTTIFTCGENETRITDVSEESIVNAVIKVTRGEKKKIYFLAGHGEADMDNAEPSGFSFARDDLLQTQYQLENLHLYREENSVPKDCSVLVLASPTKNLEKNEIQLITRYLEEGGKLLVLVDPGITTGLEPVLEDWGVNIGNDCVVDTNPVARMAGGGDVVMPVVSTYGQHPITNNFKLMTMFPYVRSVNTQKGVKEAKVSTLLLTTKESWAEMSKDKAQFTPGIDKKGPVSLGVAVEKSYGGKADTDNTRIVVIGDSDFASNRYYTKQGNGNLFQNSINWLAEEGDLISIKAKTVKSTPLTLTKKDNDIILLLVLVLQPCLFLGTGFLIWLYRRSL